MARRLIDISVPLQAGIASDPANMLPKIEYVDHKMSAPRMAEYMGVRLDQLPEGEYAAVENVQISTHNGTHLDAPYHYFSRMNERLVPGGEASWRIDEVPLEWCFQPAVKLDFRHLPDGYVATPGDVEAELKRIGVAQVSHVAGMTQSDAHFKEIVEVLAPQGRFGLIDALPTANINMLKIKSISLHWEMMFTRSQFNTPDMLAQNRLLTEVAHLVDAGVIRSTFGENFGRVNASNLKRAHALLESGKARGKIVLEGF